AGSGGRPPAASAHAAIGSRASCTGATGRGGGAAGFGRAAIGAIAAGLSTMASASARHARRAGPACCGRSLGVVRAAAERGNRERRCADLRVAGGTMLAILGEIAGGTRSSIPVLRQSYY